MNGRDTEYLLERHILPTVLDEIEELGSFLEATEEFVKSLYDQKVAEFVADHHRRGIHELPGGTSLEDFFHENYLAFPEGRLTQRLRHSFVVSLFSLVEWSLLDLCRSLTRRDVPIKVSEIRADSEIDRAKAYISKILGADFPSETSEWAQIQLCRRVRNSFVHGFGKLPPQGPQRRVIEEFASRNPDSLQIRGEALWVSADFLKQMISAAKAFFESLGSSLVSYSEENKALLEPPEDSFGEFYIGRETGILYVGPPPGFNEEITP